MSKPYTGSTTPVRSTYFLVAGEIVFAPAEGEPSQSVLINAVVISPDGRFPVARIAKAQQALQFQFIKRMNTPTIQILDVIILSLIPLGTFTDEEFNAAPKGMKVEEMKTDDIFKTL